MAELSKLDREYRDRLRKLNKVYSAAVVFMLICTGILFAGTNWYELKINDHALSFLMGFFVSITIIFIIFIVRNHQTMKNVEKLKQLRIVRTDERNIQISGKALQVASYVMVIVLVILSVIGSFVSGQLMYIASNLLGVFTLSYLLCYYYFKKKL